MAKKAKTSKTTHYVHDSGSGVVTQSLMRAKHDDFEKIYEHPDTECFDLRGHLVHLSLYEVPIGVLDKIKAARLKGDMTFREFVQTGDGPITEVPEDVPEKQVSKKKEKKRKDSEKIVFPGKSSAALTRAKADLERLRAKVKPKIPVSQIAKGAPVS